MTKKKILVLSSRIPYPLTAGFRIRIYNFIKYLSKEYVIDLLCLSESEPSEDQIQRLSEVCNEVKIIRIKKYKCIFNSLKSIYNHKPLQINYYFHKKVLMYTKKIAPKYDLIICNHIRMTEYLKGIDKPKVLDFHDAISLNYERVIHVKKGLIRGVYSFEQKRVLCYELDVISYFDATVIVSETDKNYLVKKGADENKIAVIPVAVRDDIKQSVSQEQEESIAFLGKMSYMPNEDAVVWFAENVFPSLKAKRPNLKFYVIGIEPSNKVLQLSKINGIIVTGYVNYPYEIISKCKVVIAPMRLGAGIQNKILEAMFLGKVVVTTTLGSEGINCEDGNNIIIADTDKDYIESINRVLGNIELRTRVGENARRLIMENYTIEPIIEKFNDVVKHSF